jgi:7,8-dihydroneopterin aldolase/epimerase/oxygenase
VTGTIEVRGLRLDVVVGVLPDERTRTQPLSVDLDLERPLEEALRTDDLTATTDYAAVIALVVRVATDGRFSLLEALAGAIAHAALDADAGVTAVAVVVRKLAPPIDHEVDTVGVRVRLTRDA